MATVLLLAIRLYIRPYPLPKISPCTIALSLPINPNSLPAYRTTPGPTPALLTQLLPPTCLPFPCTNKWQCTYTVDALNSVSSLAPAPRSLPRLAKLANHSLDVCAMGLHNRPLTLSLREPTGHCFPQETQGNTWLLSVASHFHYQQLLLAFFASCFLSPQRKFPLLFNQRLKVTTYVTLGGPHTTWLGPRYSLYCLILHRNQTHIQQDYSSLRVMTINVFTEHTYCRSQHFTQTHSSDLYSNTKESILL